ncbi:hypothetical protein CKAH01_14296 [Colletotrichum kahawae]|uniref:Uncharacterized protein n=1 Tax=Colletotrichum kahawae TaxID=34407 RepID=A0AAE0DCV5_COLKA|nr:hypothetical protein CKAH01_14296 [Colletotrichum kahawae]
MPTTCVSFRLSVTNGFLMTTLSRTPAQTCASCLHRDGLESRRKHTTCSLKPRPNQGAGRLRCVNGLTSRHHDPRDSQQP